MNRHGLIVFNGNGFSAVYLLSTLITTMGMNFSIISIAVDVRMRICEKQPEFVQQWAGIGYNGT